MEKTAMQQAIEFFDYRDPYHEFKAQDVVNKLVELLPAERDAIVEAYSDGWVNDSPDAEQYYRTKYGETKG